MPPLSGALSQRRNVARCHLHAKNTATTWSECARLGLTIDDLRRYCLDMLRSRRALDEDAPDYLRGYREGFQLVLRDLRDLD